MASSASAKKSPADYGASSLTVLKGLEPVRERPGMYIGGTGPTGLHHLIWEVVDNAVDEAMNGHCTKIDVVLHKDGSLSVQDNGRGIPTDVHPTEKISGVEVALTILHAGGKFNAKDSYKATGGLHGVGVSVVNALSAYTEVTVDCHGKRHFMRFERGTRTAPLKVMGPTKARGTRVHFLPDPVIFTETTTFDHALIATRLKQTACLNPGLTITLTDARQGKGTTEVFKFAKGIAELVGALHHGKAVVHTDVVHVTGTVEEIEVDVAFQYNQGHSDSVASFANNVRTADGGTHETGFSAALTKAVKQWVLEHGTAKQQKVELEGTDLREGLVAVVAVRLARPQFEGQTKGRLNNSEVRGAVQTFVYEQLKVYFAKRQSTARAIVGKAMLAAQAREAARKAKDFVREKKNLLDAGVLPGKLADCASNDATRNELFVVEGDSAGGSAKQGRDRAFQAILPLKGKILNVEKATPDKMMASEEIRAIVTALGVMFGEGDLERLRYHKIILMTDADVDGAHIRALLLTLLLRHFPALIERGHIYIAQPPLYRIGRGDQTVYAYSDAEKARVLATRFAGKTPAIQRYKGLGEQSAEELWQTTMDPAHRTLLQVTMADAARADQAFSLLMGDDAAPRREWIIAKAKAAPDEDLDI